MASPKYRLVYFNMKSLGEPIRWIFAYSGIAFEDSRIPTDFITWFTQKKAEFETTVGQVPVLYVDDNKRPLSQSSVISRYLATQTGLIGDNPWDNAKLDEVISLLFDLYDSWRKAIFLEPDVEKRAVQMETVLIPKFKLYYKKFEQILGEVPQGDFILGEKVTHADFWLAHLVSFFDRPLSGELPAVLPPGLPVVTDSQLPVGVTEEFPLLKKHLEAVTSLPQIKAWLEKRPKTAF